MYETPGHVICSRVLKMDCQNRRAQKSQITEVLMYEMKNKMSTIKYSDKKGTR